MYDYVRWIRENREKAVTTAIIIAFLLLAVGWVCYCLGLRNTGAGGEDLHNDGNPAAGVRTEIDAAGSSVSTAKSRIDNATAAADRVEARISNAQERAEYIKGTANEGRRIIAECQSILREVRRRGEADKAAH